LQRRGHVVEIAVEDGLQLVQRQVDAVVGEPALREVVGPDPVAAVAAADQALARRGFLRGAFVAVLVAQPRRQHRHRLGLVAVLRAVVLALGDDAGRQVGDADRAVGLVDVLTAGAAGAEGVDAQLGRVQRHFLGLVGLGQDRDGAGAGVDAALRLGHRHTLHAVPAGLELEPRVDVVPFDAQHHFLVAAQIAAALAHQLGLPAAALAVAQVHAREVGGEQGRLVAAGAGADFEEGVARVVRVARQQRGLQLQVQPVDIGARLGDLLLRHLGHVRLVEYGLRVGEVALTLFELAKLLDQPGDLGVLARQLAKALHVARDARVAERRVELVQAQREALELLAEGVFHAGTKSRSAR
jgi:hypothetical protein